MIYFLTMNDRFRDVPFIWPVNLLRLNTLAHDVTSALMLRVLEARAKRDVIESGAAESIDEGRFPKGTYEYGLQLGAIVGMKYPDIVTARHAFEDSIDHGIVQFLSTRGLSILRKDLGALSGIIGGVDIFGSPEHWH